MEAQKSIVTTRTSGSVFKFYARHATLVQMHVNSIRILYSPFCRQKSHLLIDAANDISTGMMSTHMLRLSSSIQQLSIF